MRSWTRKTLQTLPSSQIAPAQFVLYTVLKKPPARCSGRLVTWDRMPSPRRETRASNPEGMARTRGATNKLPKRATLKNMMNAREPRSYREWELGIERTYLRAFIHSAYRPMFVLGTSNASMLHTKLATKLERPKPRSLYNASIRLKFLGVGYIMHSLAFSNTGSETLLLDDYG